MRVRSASFVCRLFVGITVVANANLNPHLSEKSPQNDLPVLYSGNPYDTNPEVWDRLDSKTQRIIRTLKQDDVDALNRKLRESTMADRNRLQAKLNEPVEMEVGDFKLPFPIKKRTALVKGNVCGVDAFDKMQAQLDQEKSESDELEGLEKKRKITAEQYREGCRFIELLRSLTKEQREGVVLLFETDLKWRIEKFENKP